LLGRTYRSGVASPVHQTFVLTPDRREQKVASRVAGKLQTMGAFVHGIESDTNQETLAHFALVGGLPEDDDEMHRIRRSQRPGPPIIALRKATPWQEPFSVHGAGTGYASPSTGAPVLVLRRYTIHTDEGDIPVELTFDPHPYPVDDQPGIGLRVSPLVSG
jgi:hypothetical protein